MMATLIEPRVVPDAPTEEGPAVSAHDDPESYRCLNCGCPLKCDLIALALPGDQVALVCSFACETQLLEARP